MQHYRYWVADGDGNSGPGIWPTWPVSRASDGALIYGGGRDKYMGEALDDTVWRILARDEESARKRIGRAVRHEMRSASDYEPGDRCTVWLAEDDDDGLVISQFRVRL